MKNNDIIQRFLFENANVRGQIVRLNQTYQTITGQHAYPPLIQRLLGEVLAVTSLLSAIIKFKGRLNVQFQGKEPLKLVLAQCNNDFEMRAVVQWSGDLSEQDLQTALKAGILGIIINPDATTSGYQGLVSWEGDSIAKSVEGYFRDSEQIPTRLWLAVNETSVTGLLLQAMPEAESKKTDTISEDNDWERLVLLTQTITPEELLNLDNQTILHRLYSQEEVRLFESAPVSFRCTCSLARGEVAVEMLGQEEAEAELADKQKIVVTCDFCNTEYSFDRIDVANIFKKGNKSSSDQMH